MKRTVFIMVMIIILAAVTAHGGTPLERYMEADLSVGGGDGFKTSTNETATLAWGESYIMMSYGAAYLGSGDRFFLDKLADHADHVLANRDDVRGVTDYRGVSGACWRNLHYQPADEPYGYAVHSGMITYPMAAFVKIVREDPTLDDLTTYDGSTYLDKADRFATALYETIAFHEDQWRDAGDGGYYIFREDATFLPYSGRDLPLNQGNALGRTILTLGVAEADGALLDRAARMARWLETRLTYSTLDDCYLWNYWGGTYAAPGEDISHGAINVDFAVLCAEAGVVFAETDSVRFAHTFSRRVYESSDVHYDHVGGSGGTLSYTAQTGRWLQVSPFDPTVYCAVRNQYDAISPGPGSGSVVLGFGNVFRYDLAEPEGWHFTIDGWVDMGDYRVASDFDGGVYFLAGTPANRKLALTYESAREVEIRQVMDGREETVARFGPTDGGTRTLFFGCRSVDGPGPEGYGSLFRIRHADRVYEGTTPAEPPVITSEPTESALLGVPYTYQAEAEGTAPIHFTATLDGRPVQIDRLTGRLELPFFEVGERSLVVTARNTAGRADQAFTVTVEAGAACFVGAIRTR